MRKIKVIISGGGTGGHIFPAIAIANRLKEELQEVEILFIGAKGKMEMKRVPEAGYNIKGLWISGFQRKLSLKNLLLPFKIISALREAKRIITEFQPDVVVGVGGYASAPTLKMASKLQVPSLIQEQNSFPGKTNKYLSKFVSKVCVAYENLDRFFPKDKIVLTGNPIRRKVVQIDGLNRDGLDFFHLNPNRKTILVVGGSLGAKTLNESVLQDIEKIQEQEIQVIWQCGKYQYKELKEKCSQKKMGGIHLIAFIKEMEMAYAAADLIISRAGAIAISELCVIGKPVILVPSPNVAEDHQTKNAMALVKENAAILVKDIEARKSLLPTALETLKDGEKMKSLSKNIKKGAIKNADERIVEVIKKLIL